MKITSIRGRAAGSRPGNAAGRPCVPRDVCDPGVGLLGRPVEMARNLLYRRCSARHTEVRVEYKYVGYTFGAWNGASVDKGSQRRTYSSRAPRAHCLGFMRVADLGPELEGAVCTTAIATPRVWTPRCGIRRISAGMRHTPPALMPGADTNVTQQRYVFATYR